MKTRVKFHQFPGDISKQEKIMMLEDKNHPNFKWLWKNIMKLRARAVENRRGNKKIKEETS